jgi:hypothetical protein
LHRSDRLFWILLRHFWTQRKTVGRPTPSGDIRPIIQTWAHENSTWSALRIHGELLKLGVHVSERSVSRYLSRLRRNGNAGQRWRTFIKNHHESIAGMDFFTIMTANFRILRCLFHQEGKISQVMSSGRGRTYRVKSDARPAQSPLPPEFPEPAAATKAAPTAGRANALPYVQLPLDATSGAAGLGGQDMEYRDGYRISLPWRRGACTCSTQGLGSASEVATDRQAIAWRRLGR